MKTNRMTWLRFYQLNIAEDFFSGKFRYCKSGFLTGHTVLGGEVIFIFPWEKVRSARPYGHFKPAIVPPAISTAPGALSVVVPPSAHTEPVAGEEKP